MSEERAYIQISGAAAGGRGSTFRFEGLDVCEAEIGTSDGSRLRLFESGGILHIRPVDGHTLWYSADGTTHGTTQVRVNTDTPATLEELEAGDSEG